MPTKHIVIIGAPGSGKSSIAKLFEAMSDNSYEHISSGEIARTLAVEDDLTQTALTRGEYAPESAMRAEIVAHIEEVALAGKHIVMEGFPRMLAQVVVLEEALKTPPLYVEILCPEYICLQRAIKRGREHDKPDALASRFEAWHRDTVPVVDMLRSGANYLRLPNIIGDLNITVRTLQKRIVEIVEL